MARSIARMKKELSMLQKDPPHGVSCWPVSEDKLDRWEAKIIGGNGTAFEGGVFKLEIIIPERYPFEPPKVHFLTKIYHPNIDDSGRICLDVLKMPPQGSWKPAHNISTGSLLQQLLLAEPNPDDGLMSEISMQYKYDRPRFTLTAKEWVQKYAVEDSGSSRKRVAESNDDLDNAGFHKMNVDNFTAQAEELEALKAIYEEDLKVDKKNGSHCVTVKTVNSGLFAQLEFMFPDDYPSHCPPVFEIKCIYLAIEDVSEISATLETMYSKGEVVLYQWIEWIREYLESKTPRDDNKQLTSTVQATANSSPTASQKNSSQESRSHTLVYLDPPEWVHGEPITDRRSTFQAHAAVVQTTDEVEVGLTLLKENKKIASATHNILAYRLQDPKKRALVQDCDDDGETAAGGRLLHLLQIMDVMNVLVVVSRWYGGIQLGPDRFKHINNAARILLQQTKIGSNGKNGGANGSGKTKTKSSRNKK